MNAIDRIEEVVNHGGEFYVPNDVVLAMVAHIRALEGVLDVACKLTPNPVPRSFDVVTDRTWSDLRKAAAATAETRSALERAAR